MTCENLFKQFSHVIFSFILNLALETERIRVEQPPCFCCLSFLSDRLIHVIPTRRYADRPRTWKYTIST